MLDDGWGRFAVFLRRMITINKRSRSTIIIAAAMAPPAIAESFVFAKIGKALLFGYYFKKMASNLTLRVCCSAGGAGEISHSV